MDNLIKELVKEFKKQENKIKKESEKCDKANKIVAKVNENGDVEVLGIDGSQSSLLSTICVILKEIEKNGGGSAEHMAKVILITLEMEKEMND